MDFLPLFLAFIILLLILLSIFLFKRASALEEDLNTLQFSKASQSVKYGKLTEQWIPLAKQFPYPPEQFRFLGSPIDGIVFGEYEVVLCEFKSSGAQLNENQKRIKKLVEDGKVKWYEFNAR